MVIKFKNQSSLLHAAMTGNVPIARLLVKLPGLDVNLADNEGNTALHLASQAGKNSFFFLNCSF